MHGVWEPVQGQVCAYTVAWPDCWWLLVERWHPSLGQSRVNQVEGVNLVWFAVVTAASGACCTWTGQRYPIMITMMALQASSVMRLANIFFPPQQSTEHCIYRPLDTLGPVSRGAGAFSQLTSANMPLHVGDDVCGPILQDEVSSWP